MGNFENIEIPKDNRRKIVYLDDVVFHLMATKERLKNYYDVVPAKSAEDLFDVLESVMPDLILLDINMPEVNGFEVIQQIKANPRYAQIPVVFLTAQNDNDIVFKALNLGAAAYVNKPFDTPALVEQIEIIFDPDNRKNPFEELKSKEEYPGRPRILAVDDFPMMLMTIHASLRDLYNVYTLNQPEKLKGFLHSIKPDLFLLDNNMPVLSGFDLVPIIRSFPEHKTTPIIFITGDASTKNMAKAMSLGACDLVTKPIFTNTLREKVAKHINTNK